MENDWDRCYPLRVAVSRIIVFGLSLLITAGSVVLGSRWLYEGKAFLLDTVSLEKGEQISEAEIQSYLQEFLGKPLYGISLAEVSARLLQHPLVSDAFVRRIPPSTVGVRLIERKPIARVNGHEQLFLDQNGQLFQFAYLDKPYELVDVHSRIDALLLQRAAKLIVLLKPIERVVGALKKIEFGANDDLVAFFTHGLSVHFGKEEFLGKRDRLQAILQNYDAAKIPFSYIYLDNSPNLTQVAVKFK